MNKLPLALWALGWFPSIAAGRYLFILSQGDAFTPIQGASGATMVGIWFIGLAVFWPWQKS